MSSLKDMIVYACLWGFTAGEYLLFMRARIMQVSQEAAWVVMKYIDFRAAVECLFRSDIIRTEKLYKIAAVLTIKIKKYLCTHLLLPPPPMAVPLRASKCSKFGKVWLWSQLPHNTWSLISQRTGGDERQERLKEAHPLFTINLFHYSKFFFALCQKVLSLGM